MQVQTTDNLFANGIITDAVTYLESIPDGYVKNKQEIIRKIKEKQAQDQLLQQAAAMGGVVNGSVPKMQDGVVSQAFAGT